MRGFSLDHLQSFLDVVEFGSFTAAAERAGLSQPAISQQVRQLERNLGVALIERVGKRAQPTPAGEELIVHARQIGACVETARRSMAPHSADELGRVRIGTSGTTLVYVLPRILQALRKRFPGIEITVRTDSAVRILQLLEENAIDLGLVTLPVSGRQFEVTPVFEDPLVAIAPADDTTLPEAVTPADFEDRPFIHHPRDSNGRRIIDDWFLAAGHPIRPSMELPTTEAIKEMVGVGLGYAIIPKLAFRFTRDRSPLLSRPLKPHLARRMGLVLRRDKVLYRGLRETMKAIRDVGDRLPG